MTRKSYQLREAAVRASLQERATNRRFPSAEPALSLPKGYGMLRDRRWERLPPYPAFGGPPIAAPFAILCRIETPMA